MTDVLRAGNQLSLGGTLDSLNGAYTLTLQSDGNLVLTEGAGTVVWASGTDGKGVERADFQTDGNFVLYNGAGEGVWSTRTEGSGADRVVLQDDRNLVVYAGDADKWASNTATDAPAPAREAAPEPAPAPAEAPPAPPAPAPRTHTVQSGDTLWAIAEQYLGDGNRYTEIAQHNGIANPDLINVGQVITIP
ncbi:LysM peptidoglycan-binding domain-containing protein [Tsukamurella sp. 1534]|uniref:LysM peptidoglycan-binding domain-containing protein n=1 Tax=Tsukamurella sp. 1534 TaxID=1151061 RepID=UPI0003029A2C|nr:LysM peptidoglycan-binding domain-containing protein [Tsukamurella sp. 1534]